MVSSCEPETEEVAVDKVEWDADLKAHADGKTVDTDQAPFSVADKVTVTPDNATNKVVVYDSSDKTVATISAEGVITVLAAGTSNITATAGGKSDIFLLTVIEPDSAVPVDKVEWNAELKAGKTVEEGATSFSVADMVSVTPGNATDKSLTFDSSDKTVATISTTGIIMIFDRGETEISATANNGKNDVFTLTVTERTSIDVESIAWSQDMKDGVRLAMGQTLDVSGETTVLPDEATDKTVTYESSSTSVATINQAGVITPVGPGETQIKAMAGEDKADTFTLTVSIGVAFDTYLSSASIVVPVGASNRIWGHINVIPMPADLKAKNIDFTSEDENIATVDQYGVVYDLGLGHLSHDRCKGTDDRECLQDSSKG